MTPYLFVLFFIISFSVLGMFKMKKDTRNIFFFFSFLLLFLFSGLRYDIGMDYSSYKDIYNESLGGISSEIKELGWAYFFYYFRSVGVPFPVIILLISFVTIYLMFAFIRRYSPYPFLSILIFFCFSQYYTYTFNVMRQCLACYVFLNLLVYIQKRELIKYILGVGFTVFFVHSTAIILLPLYFILYRSYSIFLKIGVIIVAVLCSKYFILLIMSSDSYKIYLAFDQYAEKVTITSYILMFIGVSFLIYEEFVKEKTAQEILLLNVNYISLLFLVLVCFFSGTPLIIVFLRFACYFTPVLIVLLPLMIKKMFSPYSRIAVITVVMIMYVFIFFYGITSGGEKNKLIPYKTVLF